ncbi:MAG TPA: hypothetical protein VHA57_03690 [Actinomycetota bacterium]|nr:hypothetical protein [Actinomycetota bacterium]
MGFLDRLRHDGLGWFELQVGSLELRVGTKAGAAGGLRDEARIVAMHHWEQLEAYVASNSAFQTSFVPLPVGNGAPPVVRAMGEAADAAGVGPMVTLPGAIAEAVARDLSTHAREVIVTTEGDTYAVNGRAQTFVVDPGAGPERPGMGVRVPGGQPYAFYTSAGRSRLHPSIGHARVVAVLAEHGAVADAAASAIGLAMMHPTHVERALLATRRLEGQGLKGVLIVAGSTIGVWGSIEIVPAPRPANC